MRAPATGTRSAAAIRTRDLFLAEVASKLEAQVKALASSSRRGHGLQLRAAITELHGFARELRIVADPPRAIPLRLRRVDLRRALALILANHGQPLIGKGLELEPHGRRRAAGSRRELPSPKRGGRGLIGRLDREHLATMVLELLSNAAKYRRGRPIRLELTARGKYAQLIIANHGDWVGPKPNFERFSRGESRRSQRGFGIGLWLTRRLAEAHGGTLRILRRGGQIQAVLSLPLARTTLNR